MRKIVRNEAPSCLMDSAQAWTAEFVALRKTNPNYRFSWRSDKCYEAIRQKLSEMTQGHCAFCDGQIGTESRETVEHFRPKSQFPDLAYAWGNLFPCCDMCQSQKLEKFDPALLKPDDVEYRFDGYFIANYRTGELEPLPGASQRIKQSAETTIQLYGLNLPARNKARIREWERFSRDLSSCVDDYNYRFFLE